eukprot:jgi/Galph1/4307/GphlegSOOS_G3007.1
MKDSLPRKEVEKELQENIEKYKRPQQQMKKSRTKELNPRGKRMLGLSHSFAREAAKKAAEAEVLLTENSGFIEEENDLEKTYSLSQSKLKSLVDDQTKRKVFDWELDVVGPYKAAYSRSSRSLLIAGRKGHVGLTYWREARLQTEFYLQETIRDSTFLHNDQYFALARKKYTFIYDSQGIELHCLREHRYPTALVFLPYHLLLVSCLENGNLIYTDTSIGTIVSKINTKLGKSKVMSQNSRNGVVHLGHKNGVVTFWTPATSNALLKMLVHRGPVSGIGFDPSGQHMITTGVDRKVKVWDLRTLRLKNEWTIPCVASHLDVSQRGLLALSMNSQVWIWKDYLEPEENRIVKPYMKELISGREIHCLSFCPFEDVLGVGHATGFSSLVIPGAGEPNFDSYEIHPYETKSQRKEKEIRLLLEKVPPSTIALDPSIIGSVEQDPETRLKELKEIERNANPPKERIKKRKRGRNKLAAKLRRKQQNVNDEQRIRLQERLLKEKEERKAQQNKQADESVPVDASVVPDSVPTFLAPLYQKNREYKKHRSY